MLSASFLLGIFAELDCYILSELLKKIS